MTKRKSRMRPIGEIAAEVIAESERAHRHRIETERDVDEKPTASDRKRKFFEHWPVR